MYQQESVTQRRIPLLLSGLDLLSVASIHVSLPVEVALHNRLCTQLSRHLWSIHLLHGAVSRKDQSR